MKRKIGRFEKWRQIWRALMALRADKEDTAQVFIILTLLGERDSEKSFARFMREGGARAQTHVSGGRDLYSYLNDSDYLQSQPAGSLGREYYEFITREEISAAGLAQASADGMVEGETARYHANDEHGRYQQRQRDAHDLWHVVTGYGRDGLGELALLAFTWRQTGNLGILLIIALGFYDARAQLGFGTMWRVLREGFRLGKTAQWLPLADWEALFARPLSEVRRELRLTPPRRYGEVVAANPELQAAI